MTINALAREMVMDRTTLGRNILPLERDGLIAVRAAERDRRARQIHLTKAGEKRLAAAYAGWKKAQAHFEASFGPRRAAGLRTLLRDMVAHEL